MKRRTKRIGAAVMSLAMVMSMIPGNVSKAVVTGYSYLNDYSLGYSGGVVVYEGGTSSKPVAQTDVKIFDNDDDLPF